MPIPAGIRTTRLAAKTSTWTPTRAPSRGRHDPITGPLTGGWKAGPRPIGRASASNLGGGAGVCDGRSVDPHPAIPSSANTPAATPPRRAGTVWLRQALDIPTVKIQRLGQL